MQPTDLPYKAWSAVYMLRLRDALNTGNCSLFEWMLKVLKRGP